MACCISLEEAPDILTSQGGHQKFGFQIEENRGQKEDQIEDIFYQIVYAPKTNMPG